MGEKLTYNPFAYGDWECPCGSGTAYRGCDHRRIRTTGGAGSPGVRLPYHPFGIGRTGTAAAGRGHSKPSFWIWKPPMPRTIKCSGWFARCASMTSTWSCWGLPGRTTRVLAINLSGRGSVIVSSLRWTSRRYMRFCVRRSKNVRRRLRIAGFEKRPATAIRSAS